MMDTINGAMLFLISTLFDIYLFVLVIRIILVYVRANYFDQFTRFITTLTDFIIKPLRRIIPNIGRFELASIVLLFVLELIKYFIISILTVGIPNILGLVVLAFGDIIKIILQTFFYAILLQAILSWIQPTSLMNRILAQFTYPVLRPFQRIIPPINGFDISTIPALIILQLLIILVVNPIMRIGILMAIGQI